MVLQDTKSGRAKREEACTGDVKCMLVACSDFCLLAGYRDWNGEEAHTGRDGPMDCLRFAVVGWLVGTIGH